MPFLNKVIYLLAYKYKLTTEKYKIFSDLSYINICDISKEFKSIYTYILYQIYDIINILLLKIFLSKKYKIITFTNKYLYEGNLQLYNVIIDTKNNNIYNYTNIFDFALNLNNIYIKNLKIIPFECFFNCINLKKVIIGKNTKIIKAYAFNNCISLMSIYIPKTIQIIESNAFNNCISLKKIYFY